VDEGPRPPAGPHVFVDDVEHPVLAADDRHHLARVLRLRPGDALTVSDGRGRRRPVRFGDELVAAGEVGTVAAPRPPLAVGFALVKGGRPELVVQKLTELGLDRIVPFVAERSVVRWDGDRATRQIERLRKVAREAAMQSRRCHLPEVAELHRFTDLIGGECGPVALAQRGGQRPSLRFRTILIGPEGGWSQSELACAVPKVALGDHVLRAETAAITLGSLLTALRSGLVQTAN
jgi:16S rRNA (uracil1498-N3)-methyltransferase